MSSDVLMHLERQGSRAECKFSAFLSKGNAAVESKGLSAITY